LIEKGDSEKLDLLVNISRNSLNHCHRTREEIVKEYSSMDLQREKYTKTKAWLKDLNAERVKRKVIIEKMNHKLLERYEKEDEEKRQMEQ